MRRLKRFLINLYDHGYSEGTKHLPVWYMRWLTNRTWGFEFAKVDPFWNHTVTEHNVYYSEFYGCRISHKEWTEGRDFFKEYEERLKKCPPPTEYGFPSDVD